MSNRLAGETSPYLLQHRNNPVDWQPWGREALDEARRTDRPILLSVGYAACHWCHVMAHESFEDAAIAERINRLFVPIKVDREERPDLDALYQHALMAMGQTGGWPLTFFLTPDGDPIWGGTYFPPTSRWGRPGFADILERVGTLWAEERGKVLSHVGPLRAALDREALVPGAAPLTLSLLDESARQIARVVDPHHGGVRGAPKFPQPGLFDFLWRGFLRTGDDSLRDAVTITLDHICRGGVYDHLGGGFMRYSTDETWTVPHFEKMLYDNAQLVDLLTLVWQSTGSPLYRQRVYETLDWVLRDMRPGEDGTFAASLDADSEGEEGKYYTWDLEEIRAILDPADADLIARVHGVRPDGNWEGRSILVLENDPATAEEEARLRDARARLLAHRSTRIPPGRDDKVLADWNGLMIAALANAGFVFDNPAWIAAARMAFETIRARMALPGHRLAHSLCRDRVGSVGLLDDLAHMARAALTLFDVTGERSFLDQARHWVAAADQYHWDERDGGYFQTVAADEDVIVRLKPWTDAAVPSANGVMAQVLVRLWLVTGEDAYRERGQDTLDVFSGAVLRHCPAMPALLAGFEALAAPVQVVLAGDDGQADMEALLAVLAATPGPTRAIYRVDGHPVPMIHPAHGKGPINGAATAYVCRSFTCTSPLTTAGDLRAALEPAPGS